MKKILKIVGISALVIVFLYCLTSVMLKHSWRLWGFEKCASPNGVVHATNVYVTDEFVFLSGATSSSALRYNGYTCKLIDKTLYVGVRYGLFEGDGDDFSFQIEGDFSGLENVILTNKTEERCIWNLQKHKKYKEKIRDVRLYKTVTVSNENDYKTQMQTAEYVLADTELLNRIQHPVFSEELHLSKGDGYLGVAELDNGEELCLEFARHFNYYVIIGESGYYEY